MGAYTSCTVFCDHEKRRGVDNQYHGGRPYKYNCSNEPTPEGRRYCSSKICGLCKRADENQSPCDFPLGYKLSPNGTTAAILHCPTSGLSEPAFVSLVFCGAFFLLVIMGICQYFVGWAYIKERKIYKKLGKLNTKARLDKRSLGSQSNKTDFNPHVNVEEVFLQEDEEDSKSKKTPKWKNQDKLGPTAFRSVAAMQNQSVAPTYAKQTRSVPNSTPVTEEGDSETWDESEITSILQQEQQEGPRPELKPLRKAMWMACGCQIAVVFGVFTCFVYMSYIFIHYKPEVEKLARGPSLAILFED